MRAWLGLTAFGLVALAVLLWAIFGKITMEVNAQARIQGLDAVLTGIASNDLLQIAVGQSVYICEPGVTGSITAVEEALVTARLTTTSPAESCPARIVVQELRPIQRLLP